MKCLILLGIIAVAHAGILPPAAPVLAAPALLSTGSSIQSRTQDGHGNYAFAYDEVGATGGTFRQEHGSPAGVVGSYGLRAADGRQRIVNYVADSGGFRANVQTNEPGVDPSRDPAATHINKAGTVAAAPAAPLLAAAPSAPLLSTLGLPAPAPLGLPGAPLALAAGAPASSIAIPSAGALTTIQRTGPLAVPAAPLRLASGFPLGIVGAPLGIPASPPPGLAGAPWALAAGAPASSIAIPSAGALTTIQRTGPLAAPAAPSKLPMHSLVLPAYSALNLFRISVLGFMI